MSKSRVLEAFTAALLDDDPRALYDQAPCGYLTLAPDGTVVKTNTTLRTMLRCTDDLAGTTLHELLVPSAHRPALRSAHQWCMEPRNTVARSSARTSRGAVASSRCCFIAPSTRSSTSESR